MRTGFAPSYPPRWPSTSSVNSFSPPIPYMICSSPSSPATSMTKAKKSFASHSNPSVLKAQSAKVESRIHE